ncbi:MAG: DUF2189 domain-containing protein [Salinisphaeraceae bacterium]|nr:DUF2189 domain-containing protein [Salinisphaeraceae bacterium]
MSISSDLHGHDVHHDHHRDHNPHISLLQPFSWLARGWDDLTDSPRASLTYGFIVAFMGLLLFMLSRHPYFVAAVVTSFLLVGPILTTGICELSRRQGKGEPASFDASLEALTRNRRGLSRFAMGLLGLGLFWFTLSTTMLTQILGSAAPDFGLSVWAMWSEIIEMMTADQLLAYLIVGGALAVVVFALSVVTVPMLIDRKVSASEATMMSVRQTIAHLPTMIVWAAIIVALVALGFATFMLGLIVVFPLLGHATWHAYRDLTIE